MQTALSELDVAWSLTSSRRLVLTDVCINFDFLFFVELIRVFVLTFYKQIDSANDAEHQHSQDKDGEAGFKVYEVEPMLDLLMLVSERDRIRRRKIGKNAHIEILELVDHSHDLFLARISVIAHFGIDTVHGDPNVDCISVIRCHKRSQDGASSTLWNSAIEHPAVHLCRRSTKP